MQTQYQIDADIFTEAESAFSKLKAAIEPISNNPMKVKLRQIERLFRQARLTNQPDDEVERANLENATATYSYFAEKYPTVPPAVMPAMFQQHLDRLSATLSGAELVDAATQAFERECQAYWPPSR